METTAAHEEASETDAAAMRPAVHKGELDPTELGSAALSHGGWLHNVKPANTALKNSANGQVFALFRN